jgi:uncharacterized protein YunC (DUF1805 family)
MNFPFYQRDSGNKIVAAVSKDAAKLGIKVGMTGAEAMELLR